MDAGGNDLIDRLARGWRAYAAAALIALLAAWPGMTRLPVMDRDEARFAQATTQMLETGDFVRINVQATPRNKKPIGIHWLQAAAVSAVSHVQERAIWAYRLPSLLGAVLAACACFWGGAALLPRRTALMGAALFAACVLLGFEGMTAKTDAALCGFTTLAMAALAQLYARAPEAGGKRWALLFWIALGAGVLIKGPVTPMVAALTLLALGVWERRWRWMRPLAFWPGPLIAAAIVLPWMIAIGVDTHGRFFADAIGHDLAPKLAGGAEGHASPFGYHLAALSVLIFPATLALPAAVRFGARALRAPRLDEAFGGVRFLLAWGLPTFLVFEILPTKLAHYPLPTYPALALLAAAGFEAARRERWRLTAGLGLALFALVAAVLVALSAYLSRYMPGDADAASRRALQGALAGAACLIPALAVMAFTRNAALKIGLAIAVELATSFVLRDRILPEARGLLISHEISEALNRASLHPRLSPHAPPLWAVGYGETSLVFETRTDMRIATPVEAGARAAAGDTIVVEQRAAGALIAALDARKLVLSPIGAPIVGLNYGNGDKVNLQIETVTPGPRAR